MIMMRRRWLAGMLVLLLAALAIGGVAVALRAGDDERDSPRGTTALGVFKGSVETEDVARFEEWLGRPVDVMESFPAEDDWEDLEGPDWLLDPLATWVAAQPGRRVVLSVPMLPGGWADDDTVRRELQDGADGRYNDHFRVLAERLVAAGLGDTTLRIGWEFNGGWYRWRAEPDPDAWTEYFRAIVDTMRAVDGAAFSIDWNVAVQGQHWDATRAYPGDDYVDFIGVDVYDKSWRANGYPFPEGASAEERAERRDRVWHDSLVGGFDGLDTWAEFASARGKQLSVPEWGVTEVRDEDGRQRGGLDNAAFIQRMADWISRHDVAYHVYFDYRGPDGDHLLSSADTRFPQSAAAFRAEFGG